MGDWETLPLAEGATFVSQLQKLSEEEPNKAAYIFWDKHRNRTVLTRRDVWDKSALYAALLHRSGVGRGDVVCNTLLNSPERLISSLGTLVAGAVSMHGQIFLADGEDIITNWKESGCKAVILDPNQEKGASSILERLRRREESTGSTSYQDLPHLQHVIHVSPAGNGVWLRSLDQEPESYVDNDITEDDTAFIFATSGSTGFAKLVPHSHKSVLQMGKLAVAMLGSNNVYFNHRSLGWVGGCPLAVPVSGGVRVLVDQSAGLPEDFGEFAIDVFNKENINGAFLLPTDIQLILDSLDAGIELKKSLGVLLTGGGPMSTVTMSAIGRFAEKIKGVYGSTELGLLYSITVTDPATYQNSCVGLPGPQVEGKILGENHEDIPAGETGEIYIRSPTLAKGYLNRPEKTRESFLEDGWFRTGDIGNFDSQGRLFVYCRKSNAISHKSFIHYPGWMENRINKHPHITRSMVVGIPDPVNQEELCVCLTTAAQSSLAAEEVREFCKSLFLTSDKDSITPIPKFYLFLDKFPVNANGKVDRQTVRKHAISKVLGNSD